MTDHTSALLQAGIADDRSRALVRLIARLDEIDLSPLLVYRIDEFPADDLYLLAWQFHVLGDEGWNLAVTEADKRDLIRRAIEIHRYRGTPWSIRQALAAVGYHDARIVENRELQQQWAEAGGGFLNGISTLDGSSTLSAPGGSFQVMTRHWAEYIIDMDVTEGVLTLDAQRTVRRLAEMNAPARSHLVGLLYRMRATWLAQISLIAMEAAIVASYRGCDQFEVPSFRSIGHGCELLGGENLPDLLDGSGPIAAFGALTGYIADGEPLDHGWGNWSATIVDAASFATGGDAVEPVEYLDGSGSIEQLDGLSAIRLETIDGYGEIDGDDTLEFDTLEPFRPHVIDGVDRLGLVVGHPGIWSRGHMTIHNHRHITREAA